jgi:hypothetical protein
MPAQLVTYYIENPLMIFSINNRSWWGVIVISLVIDFGELVKVALKEEWKKVWVGGLRSMGLLNFVAFVCVWVYFCCRSGGCLCQGLQGFGVVYIWYSRLVCK